MSSYDQTDEQLVLKLWPSFNSIDPQWRGNSYADYALLLDCIRGRLKAVDQPHGSSQDTLSEDVLSAIDQVRSLEDKPRHQVATSVKDSLLSVGGRGHVDDEYILKLVGLAATLWLTTSIETTPLEVGRNPSVQLYWKNNQSLAELLASFFEAVPSQTHNPTSDQRINGDLTMARLVERHGFSYCLTSNLADHLRINQVPGTRRRVLHVYEHKVALRTHLRLFEADKIPFPQKVIEETLDTLNLLFPRDDDPTESLVRNDERLKAIYKLGYCGRFYELEASQYVHWGSRIRQLEAVLGEDPTFWGQLLGERDGRDALRVFNFWLGVVLGIFAVVSVTTGILSTVYAGKANVIAEMSLVVAMDQYRLDLAQVCSDPEARGRLAEFCL